MTVVLRLAFRNIWLHRSKSLIVGSILVLGTVLVIVGSGLLDAIDRGMQTSIVNSVAGHLQVYSAGAKEKFQLFGNMDGSMPNIGQIKDFSHLRDVLVRDANVRTVVPMGIDAAVTTTHNQLERKLQDLRRAVKEGDSQRIGVLTNHIRRMIDLLAEDLQNADALIDIDRFRQQQGDPTTVLAKAQSETFWAGFAQDPFGSLEFLENEIGPLGLSEDLIWLGYIGTDTALFQQTFDRFEIVDGVAIPPGQRGFLFNKQFYEENIKNKSARRLDKIAEKLKAGQTIQSCDDCRNWIRRNIAQASSLAWQLDAEAAKKVGHVLRREGISTAAKHKSGGGQLTEALKRFMEMNDTNFTRRYELFYEAIAPHLVLYTVAIGETFVLTAYARGSGYVRKVPIRVYGTFRFRSLDRSPLAGGFSLMDIVSFRDLYGYMTTERKEEQEKIRKDLGVRDVRREEAEAMFSGDEALVEDAPTHPQQRVLRATDFSASGEKYNAEAHRRVHTKREIENGVVLNAAIMLHDGRKLKPTLKRLRKLIAQEDLPVKIIDWREAAGTVGQLVRVVRVVLYTAVGIIFLVALIIINNSLIMSTIERTREIGTLRAIGARRSFILKLLFAETTLLASFFGAIGALLGIAIMLVCGAIGIPASGDFVHFLFAGPTLYPPLQTSHVLGALFAIMAVAIVSTLHPGRIATRITPREAMAAEE